jgi:hypothetical protein
LRSPIRQPPPMHAHSLAHPPRLLRSGQACSHKPGDNQSGKKAASHLRGRPSRHHERVATNGRGDVVTVCCEAHTISSDSFSQVIHFALRHCKFLCITHSMWWSAWALALATAVAADAKASIGHGGGVRVIGAGLGRTGTESLRQALTELGYKTYHSEFALHLHFCLALHDTYAHTSHRTSQSRARIHTRTRAHTAPPPRSQCC